MERFDSADLSHYMAKSFAILDTVYHLIRETCVPERTAAENILKRNDYSAIFVCADRPSVKFEICQQNCHQCLFQ